MEQIRDGAQLIRDQAGTFDAGSQPLGDLRIAHRQLTLDSRKLELQGGERLPGAVVQVARDAAAFVILHAQEAHREVAQISVGLLELRGSLADTELELVARPQQHLLRAPQPKIIAAAGFTDSNDRRAKSKKEQLADHVFL